MSTPDRIATSRLVTRKPVDAKVASIFERVEQAEALVRASDSAGVLLGNTGLLFESESVASTGYVLEERPGAALPPH